MRACTALNCEGLATEARATRTAGGREIAVIDEVTAASGAWVESEDCQSIEFSNRDARATRRGGRGCPAATIGTTPKRAEGLERREAPTPSEVSCAAPTASCAVFAVMDGRAGRIDWRREVCVAGCADANASGSTCGPGTAVLARRSGGLECASRATGREGFITSPEFAVAIGAAANLDPRLSAMRTTRTCRPPA